MTSANSICIPIEFQPQGGGFYFLRSFERYLRESGWHVTKDIRSKYQVLFTNHWQVPAAQIAAAIRANPGVCIVQRIDGAAQDYGRTAESDDMQSLVNTFADLTIFQSQYCRYSTREKFPVIRQDGPVILNPVDLEAFNPQGERRPFKTSPNLAVISWSTNIRKGAGKVYQVAHQNPDVHIYLCGNYPDAPVLPNLHALGVLEREELAQTLRACDALLTFSENEACPNHVLEALASGLPVLYIDSGAMAEVIGDCGYPVTVENFPAQWERLRANRQQLTAFARQRAQALFDPAQVFLAYVEQIQQAYRVTRGLQLSRLLRAWSAVLNGR